MSQNCGGRSIYRVASSSCNTPSNLIDQKDQVDSIFEYLYQGVQKTRGIQGIVGADGPQGIQGLRGDNGGVTVCENAGLVLTDNTLCTLYNTQIPDAQISVTTGGAGPAPASEWKTLNVVEVLDKILFPTLNPTYALPTISFLASNSGIKEIGSQINQELSVTGIKNDAGPFSSLSFLRGGSSISESLVPTVSTVSPIPPQFGIENPNNPNYSYSYTYTDVFTIVSGTTTWAAEGSFGQGIKKSDSFGVEDSRPYEVLSTDAPQSASDLTSSPVSVQGIYPYFWGKSSAPLTPTQVATSIGSGNANKVVTQSSGTISATFNASSEYVWFAVPSSSTIKTIWFNTSLNQGQISPTGFILPPVARNVNSPDNYWSGVSYNVYISAFATATSGSIELRNS